MIALSAFEDRPTVLEMLRAGAVGYLVKGTAGQDLLGSIAKVVDGGASLSAELIDGIVHELSSQLRREEIEHQQRAAQRGEIDRFLSGSGVTMVYQPIVDLRTPCGRRHGGARPVPLAAAASAERMVRRGGGAGARRPAGDDGDQERDDGPSRYLPDDAYLSVNCSPRAAMSPELAALVDGDASRMVVEITEHEAIEDYEVLATALEGSAPTRHPRRDRRCRRRVREPATHRCSCAPTS